MIARVVQRMMNSMTNPNIPNPVDERLSELRQLIRKYLSIRGLTMAGIVFLLFFWITGLIDYLPVLLGAQDSPKAIRAFFLIAGLTVLAYIVWRFLIQPLSVRWTDRSVALLIERKYPQANSSLITFVENKNLSSDRSKSELSKHWQLEIDPQLQATVAENAKSAAQSIDVYDIMRWQPLKWQAGLFGGLLAVTMMGFFAFPSWSFLWSKRLFLLSDQAWPRKASISVDYLEAAIPNFTGETDRRFYQIPFINRLASLPIGQSARLYSSADRKAKLVPSSVTLNYRFEDGQTGRANLRRMPVNRRADRQPFLLEGSPLDKVKQSLTFSIRGGDVRLQDLDIDILPPIAFASVELSIQYPDYLRRRQTSTYLDGPIDYRNGLRLPEGVNITMKLTANQPLERCDVKIIQQGTNTESAITTTEVDGNKFEVPLGVLRSNILVELRPWDSHGHVATDVSQFVLTIIEDEMPNAELTLQGIGTSVTPLAQLPLQANGSDDHDIKDVVAKLIVGDKPPMEIPIEFAANGEFNKVIDLRDLNDQQKIAAQPGEVILISAEIDDFFDLDSGSRKSSSNVIPLTVVTPDELLILLDRRELELRRRLEQIIVELTQLEVLISKNRENTIVELDDADSDQDQQASALDRLRLVRTQETKIQIEKSIAELNGIAVQIASINAELVNNRIDSIDRQQRLEERIRQPILTVLDNEFKLLVAEIVNTEIDIRDKKFTTSRIDRTLELNAQAVARLNDILKSMLDIEDFNEVVDMVRDILQKQESLIEKAKEEQKKRALDLFK